MIHIGKRRVWTSRGFIPFGVSQSAIARERGMCDRTIRRHLALMDVDRRQIVQSKAEYKLAANAISQDAGSIALADNFALYARGDDYFLSESGLGGTHIHRVAEVGFARIHSRFFRYGKKPKTWLYRCNIYRPQMKLCTMSSRAREYRASTAIQPILQNVGGGGDATACKRKENSLENSKAKTPSRQKKTDIFHKTEKCTAEFKVGDSVYVAPWPHTDRLGPYPIERIEGDYAKVQMFAKLILLKDLRKA